MTAEKTLRLFRRHGGRLGDARNTFPSAPLPWIDLSTGVNPHPWRSPRAMDAALQRLPDVSDVKALEGVAAKAFGCPAHSIAAVPGADIGLRLLPHILGLEKVSIASPTYQGHADAWIAAGADVEHVARGTLLDCDADVVIAVNPNNPDGTFFTKDELLRIATRQQQRGGWVIVDESFAETAPERSVAPHIQPGLIVLRSFGKFYGLPGVRLGFVLGPEHIIRAVRNFTGDWPVSADAIALATAAYADVAWQTRTRQHLDTAGLRFDGELTANGFSIVGGTSLFRLAAHPRAEAVFLKLAAHGILVRPFDHAATWLRFGLPAETEWPRVIAALKDCRHES